MGLKHSTSSEANRIMCKIHRKKLEQTAENGPWRKHLRQIWNAPSLLGGLPRLAMKPLHETVTSGRSTKFIWFYWVLKVASYAESPCLLVKSCWIIARVFPNHNKQLPTWTIRELHVQRIRWIQRAPLALLQLNTLCDVPGEPCTKQGCCSERVSQLIGIIPIISIYLYIYICISGWWFQPLWKILVSWDDYPQYMEK